MDRALYKVINRLADHSTWAHGLVRLYAKDGIVVFAVLLLAGWWIGRTSRQPATVVAQAIAAGGGALVALGLRLAWARGRADEPGLLSEHTHRA